MLVVFLSKAMERFYGKVIFCLILSPALSLLRGTVAEKKFNQTVCFLMFWSKFAHVTGEFCWDITSFNYKSSFHAEILFKGF